MKVLLVNTPTREEALPSFIPNGLGYLAGYLIRNGHEVEIYDINALRPTFSQALSYIRNKKDIDVIGISGMITNYLYMKEMSIKIKKTQPRKFLIAGGAAPTSIPRLFIEKMPFDCVVVGEGEIMLSQILEKLSSNQDWREVGGIYFKGKRGKAQSSKIMPGPIVANLDDLPKIPYELMETNILLKNNIRTGFGFKSTINISGSRGCPYRCNFCFDSERPFRTFSVQRVFDDILYAHEKFNIDYFRFDDELFTADRKRVSDFCDLLINSGLNKKISWGCSGRVNIVTLSILKKMAKAGCVDINYGIESGSQEMLKNMNKIATVEQAMNAVINTKKAGINNSPSFMIGTRHETPATIQETVDFCKKTDLFVEEIFYSTPNPGTELWEYSKKMGAIKDEEEFIIRMCKMGDFSKYPLVNLTQMTTKELIYFKKKAQKDILKNYLFNNKFRIPKMMMERYRRVGFVRFMGLFAHGIRKITAKTNPQVEELILCNTGKGTPRD